MVGEVTGARQQGGRPLLIIYGLDSHIQVQNFTSRCHAGVFGDSVQRTERKAGLQPAAGILYVAVETSTSLRFSLSLSLSTCCQLIPVQPFFLVFTSQSELSTLPYLFLSNI